jgi:hypothetical protein
MLWGTLIMTIFFPLTLKPADMKAPRVTVESPRVKFFMQEGNERDGVRQLSGVL